MEKEERGNNMTEKQKKVFKISGLGGSVGTVAGLIYAFQKKKNFWGYVGYGLLFGIILSTSAMVVADLAIKEKEEK